MTRAIHALADGWLVIRAFLVIAVLVVALQMILPPDTFGVPVWAKMQEMMPERAWGLGLIGVAVLAVLLRRAGTLGRIIGSYLIACSHLVVGLLTLLGSPSAALPLLLLLIGALALLSAMRDAARHA